MICTVSPLIFRSSTRWVGPEVRLQPASAPTTARIKNRRLLTALPFDARHGGGAGLLRSAPRGASVDDHLGCLIQVQAHGGDLGPEGLPDQDLLLAELLVILNGGEVRVLGAARGNDVRPQHPIALVVSEREPVHFMEPHPLTRSGVG